jgi:hypothetical protein
LDKKEIRPGFQSLYRIVDNKKWGDCDDDEEELKNYINFKLSLNNFRPSPISIIPKKQSESVSEGEILKILEKESLQDNTSTFKLVKASSSNNLPKDNQSNIRIIKSRSLNDMNNTFSNKIHQRCVNPNCNGYCNYVCCKAIKGYYDLSLIDPEKFISFLPDILKKNSKNIFKTKCENEINGKKCTKKNKCVFFHDDDINMCVFINKNT